MKKIKKLIIILLIIGIIGGAATGGVYAYQKYQDDHTKTEVVYVSDLNWGYTSDAMTSSGYITNDYAQSVYTEDKTVAEVKVQEGDEVKVGDTLVVYDTADVQLQLEMNQLELQGIKNDIKLAEKAIEDLKKINPSQTTSNNSATAPTTSTNSTTNSTEPTKQETIVKMQIQKKEGEAYNYIDKTAKPYEGKGTPESPYRFLCTQECYVAGTYINKLVKKGQVATFEIWTGNSNTEGTLISYWRVSGLEQSTVEEDSKWSVAAQKKIKDEVVVVGEPSSEVTSSEEPESEEPETEADEVEYTAEELRQEIAEKESELERLKIDRRSKKLEIKKLKQEKKDAKVLATINGVVKTVGDPEYPSTDGSAFLEIHGSSGLYVEGVVSELMLEQIEIGQEISVTSWNDGLEYPATITEISEYPSDNTSEYYGEGNPNVSYYGFTAYLEESEGFTSGEYVDVSIMPIEEENMDSIYIDKAYVREENGKAYVLKAGEDNRLVKQYVQTGRTLYGSAIEIKEGLIDEDRIAFPYGKTAKEGIRVVDAYEY